MHQVAALPAASDVYAGLALQTTQVTAVSLSAWRLLLSEQQQGDREPSMDAWTSDYPPAVVLAQLLLLVGKLVTGLQRHLLAAATVDASSAASLAGTSSSPPATTSNLAAGRGHGGLALEV